MFTFCPTELVTKRYLEDVLYIELVLVKRHRVKHKRNSHSKEAHLDKTFDIE